MNPDSAKNYYSFYVQDVYVGFVNILEEKKEVLIQVLDMNQLYLSYSEIEDEQYKIPEDVKAFNHSFYQKEGVQDE